MNHQMLKLWPFHLPQQECKKNEEIIGSVKNRLMRIETLGSLGHGHPWIFVLTSSEIGQEIRQDFHQSRASLLHLVFAGKS